jgi:putative effector of murein hydrolase
MRNSKVYARFKAANSVLFVIFGLAIVYQMLRTVGLRFEAVPGLILGAAMFALGVHRAYLMLRVRQ